MKIREALEQAGRELQQANGNLPIPVEDLRRRTAQLCQRKVTSILPADYCYNRTNDGILRNNNPMFVYEADGFYRFLGPDYPYTGFVYHKPKGQPERQVGEWRNGELL